MAIIEVRNLTVNYESNQVLSNFSAAIEEGSIAAITGENGAGKTTLLSALAGDMKSFTGEISLADRSINQFSLRELARLRSVASQHHSYWLGFTVRELVAIGNSDIASARVSHYLKALEINPYLDQKVTELSGGQLQRVEIARALIRPTAILHLDEPFASQDLRSRQMITDLLGEEKIAGRTIVIVTHSEIADLSWCDQVINLDR